MHHISSPSNEDSAIERLLAAKGITAARVTPADIQDCIEHEHYFTAAEGVMGSIEASNEMLTWPPELELLTFCVLTLTNGFTVTGESACVSAASFDAAIGRRVARQNAEQKLWPLLGYALKERLAQSA